MFFSKRAYTHLAKYKKDILNISEYGEYKSNKTIINCSHILPKHRADKNILHSEYCDEIHVKIKESRIKLHKYFHHLNSSQAMCFNLFYPVVIKKKYNLLSDILDVNLNDNARVCFEYVDDRKEGTNFDFYIDDDKNKFYFEVKYTEQNFASQKSDETHIKKYKDIYLERLKIFKKVDMEDFFKNYQLFRNLIYLTEGNVVFVIPGIQNDLKRSIVQVCEKYLNEEQQSRVKMVAIETIVDAIIVNDNELKNHYKMFRQKYVFW